MTDYVAVLSAEYRDAEWILDGTDYSGLTWLSDSPKPTKAELDEAWPRVEAERANMQARAARHADFIAEADPLFMKWQAGEAEESVWLAKRAEIRDRHPYVEVPE